ncbi:hypothetical protein KDA06_05110 [Candidatus Saccharibacteria bacterium]|nr:hypothetical protein [Candidatus Saccharibacteria bacterium]
MKTPTDYLSGALSYENDYRFLCSPRPAYARNALNAGEFFIKQLEARKRAWLLGTHQNTSFNPSMVAGRCIFVNIMLNSTSTLNRGRR